MIEPIGFETERLLLRQWRAEDLDAFAALNADPRVMAFYPAVLDRAASDAMAAKIRAEIGQRGWGFWAVEVKGGAPFIGFVGLHVPGVTLPFSPCVEIGWRLAHEQWGHGYATEAARAALRVAFERLALPEVVSFATESNTRSRRVMERIGMRYSGRFEHPSLPVGSRLRPHSLYRIRGGPASE